ncbi:MAG: recombinase family protein [Alphaproteobacteria bacterium]|nr:recombinase family protein [Alphaproteobacteria bacterium]
MSPPRHRCAIYTRKSTDEGLDQEFNSLDAQREACAAYIASQTGLGWKAVKERYDDGGVSGGTLDRTALQRLLADIEAGVIDVVVVYKIDRLTRSLTDFAKIVEIFETHEVSFVSVTQQFNTTTSMGRLTLNVLLSFAQFEREVTAERIRDKIAASKKKGMWMGGSVPLGFDVRDKQLVVNKTEAATVQSLFTIYLELGSVRRLKNEADRRGLVTKRRTRSDGTITGGRPFMRGNLYGFLSNPIYVGKIRHRGNTYPGRHRPIIDPETWQAVQDHLAANAVPRHRATNARHPSLLARLVFDDTGDRLSPTHTVKNGQRYRYYISHRLMRAARDDQGGWRLPASQLECAVLLALGEFLTDDLRLIEMLRPIDAPPDRIDKATKRAAELSKKLASGSPAEQRALLQQLLQRITVHLDHLSIELNRTQLIGRLLDQTCDDPADAPTTMLHVPVNFRRRGVEAKLILGRNTVGGTHDRKLIETVARARSWLERLSNGTAATINDLATQENLHPSDISRIIPLAFLAPDIVEAVLKGEQPVELTAEKLVRCGLPTSWGKQRQLLGFARTV